MPAFLRFLTASAATTADALAGPLLETWVRANLAAHAEVGDPPARLHFYRTHEQAEGLHHPLTRESGSIEGTRPSIRRRDDDDQDN